MWDVAIIGAGLTGLTCARQLRAAGLTVCVLDKSRGLGGRMATRRVDAQDYGRAHRPVRVDHGLRYWQPSATIQTLTDELIAADVLRGWNVSAYELHKDDVLVPIESQPVYVVKAGMSAVAKYLANGLIPDETLLSNHRAIELTPEGSGWRITCEEERVVLAQRCAIAIPAAQAANLLEARSDDTKESTSLSDSLNEHVLEALRAVEYDPCLTVIAGYGEQAEMGKLDPNGWMVTDIAGSSTDWTALDSSKRDNPTETVIVIHSKPAFAERYIDTSDLQPAASVLLRANARKYCAWIAQPEWFQIHRWRYSQVRKAYPETFVALSPSLVAGGDWCSSPAAASSDASNSRHIEAAYLSGLAMAAALQKKGLL
ncbi:FAD dependent oxidoreductase, putative [Synechococcus sp. PCC 7335]|uniref:NAD(P)/FAD-dependent oxidoreductase n=1 Tax=Synechococcus sp. (strain ATCC 29403 / PCC 7335) TaxID=91464 RepID=UPI00017EE75C|nr:FAD-dependent oxidoreductase [Synechococcus sp. PCC 7335]EDX86991.1 FAD dependent oxidoreductase, putative [Synechococcus sp. PCC 7335]